MRCLQASLYCMTQALLLVAVATALAMAVAVALATATLTAVASAVPLEPCPAVGRMRASQTLLKTKPCIPQTEQQLHRKQCCSPHNRQDNTTSCCVKSNSCCFSATDCKENAMADCEVKVGAIS